MGVHETVEGTLAAVETDAIRLRAVVLVNQYNDDCDGHIAMNRADWLEWEGKAYSVLREIVRG